MSALAAAPMVHPPATCPAAAAWTRYQRAQALLTPASSKTDVDGVIALLDAALTYGPWTPNQIFRICEARRASIFDWAEAAQAPAFNAGTV